MHRRAFAMAIANMAVAVSSIAPSSARAQRATFDRILHTQTLENGMQIIVIENHSVPVVTAEIVFRAGAMTQEDDDQGVPHLFEHMLFKSYRGLNGAPFGWEAAQQHAGYNGATSDEAVMYYLALPSANTDRALGILARLVRDAHFENDDFQLERFVVLGEFQRAGSDPQFELDRESSARLWGRSFARKNVIGDELPLLKVTTSRLKKIFERYYVPNNAALIVSGDVSATKVFQMARSHFAGWERRPDPFVSHPVPAMAALDSSRAVVVAGDVNTVTLELQWQGPSVPDDPRGTYSADVLSDVLQDEQSDFHTRLVDSGLFQSADLAYTTRAHVGPITFHGVTTPANLAAALTALDSELLYMNDTSYFAQDAITAAAKRRSVAAVFELEDTNGLARSLADTWAVAGADYFRGYVDNMAKCTAADLHAFVARYLTGKPFIIAALVPKDRANETSTFLAQYISISGQ